jgi:hypothetical protein
MRSIRMRPRSRLGGIRARALVLTAGVAVLTLCLSTGVVLAGGGRDSRNAENTFTKWITDFNAGTMAGVVGGDVGDGAYAGQITSFAQTSTGLEIDAEYHFNGSTHSFTASVHIVQTGFTIGGSAVITGRVTEGWLKGNQVEGGYEVITCTQAADGTCYQGTLDILRGTKSGG